MRACKVSRLGSSFIVFYDKFLIILDKRSLSRPKHKTMSIQTEIRDQVLVIRPEGSLDKAVSGELEELLTNELDEGFRLIVFDLSQLEQISSDGLRVILHLVNEVRSVGGDVAVTGMVEQVEKALDVSGFFKLIESFDDIEKAVESLLEADQDAE